MAAEILRAQASCNSMELYRSAPDQVKKYADKIVAYIGSNPNAILAPARFESYTLDGKPIESGQPTKLRFAWIRSETRLALKTFDPKYGLPDTMVKVPVLAMYPLMHKDKIDPEQRCHCTVDDVNPSTFQADWTHPVWMRLPTRQELNTLMSEKDKGNTHFGRLYYDKHDLGTFLEKTKFSTENEAIASTSEAIAIQEQLKAAAAKKAADENPVVLQQETPVECANAVQEAGFVPVKPLKQNTK